MKNLICLLSVIVLINAHSNAQTLQHGYIVKLNQEKVSGYLEEHTDDELRNRVIFSTGLKDEKITYNANELEAFVFDYGRTFQRFVLKTWNGRDSVETPVFAKKIWSGKIEMYTVQYENNRVEYILKNQLTNEWVLLKRPVDETRIENGITIVKKDLKYLQQLTAFKEDSEQSYIEQKEIGYSKSSILANIRAYDSKYTDRYPVNYYVEKRAKLYGATVGFQIAESKKIKHAFRLNVFRDFMLIERSVRLAFHQGISYAQYNEYGNPENKFKALNFSLVGLKVQADPMLICPFFNLSFGLTYKQFPLYDSPRSQVSNGASVETLRFSCQAAAGAKCRLSPRFYLLGICSLENSFFCVNGGVAYLYSK